LNPSLVAQHGIAMPATKLGFCLILDPEHHSQNISGRYRMMELSIV
jgi:hypothetical protein